MGTAPRSDNAAGPGGLRWRTAEEDDSGALFPLGPLADRHVGTGEYRGIEFLHVNARQVINEVPATSRMPFRYTINGLSGVHPRLYILLRPSHPRVPRARDRVGLRATDRRQGQRG